MLQATSHRHADLIYLSGVNNAEVDAIKEHRKEMGQRLARLRERAGLTQPALAKVAGITQPSLWAIEAGQTIGVTASVLLSLCRALGTTIDYVWNGAELDEQDAEDAAELAAIFQQLNPPGRMAVLQSARAVLAAQQPPPEGSGASDADMARFRASHATIRPSGSKKRAA